METPPICDYEGSDYQTSFWDAGGRAYDPGAYAQVDRLVQVGCNDRRIGGKD